MLPQEIADRLIAAATAPAVAHGDMPSRIVDYVYGRCGFSDRAAMIETVAHMLASAATQQVTASERERFESFARSHYLIGSTGYSPEGKTAWLAWQARAALDQPAIPDGWQIVPKEPTEAMLADVDEVVGGHCYSCTAWTASWDDCCRVYRAMLAAAPSPK